MNAQKRYVAVVTSIILCFFSFEGCLFALTNLSADALGRAGAGVAANNIHDVYGLNPSSMLFSEYYSIGGAFSSVGNTVKASIVDTKTSAIGGALSYVYQTSQSDAVDEQINSGVFLALAGKPIPAFAFGIQGKLFWLNDKKKEEEKDEDKRAIKFDIDVGFKYHISEKVAFGGVIRNLVFTPKDDDFPLPNFAAGLSIQPTPMVTILADAGTWWSTEALNGKWQGVFAVEFEPIPIIRIRSGFRYVTDLPKKRSVAAGLKLNFETFEIAYGGELFFSTEPLVHEHAITLTLTL